MFNNSIRSFCIYLLVTFVAGPLGAYLDFANRPLKVQEYINQKFELLSQKKEPWVYGGSKFYDLMNTHTAWVALALIKANPQQKDFFLLDVGAGQFQWGEGIAEFINKRTDIPNNVKVHILNVTGENYGEITIQEKQKCILYNISEFKIENLKEELVRILPKLGLNQNSLLFDLVVSQWTFLHLVDPVGTFVQVYDVLRPKSGLALMHGFPVFIKENGAVKPRDGLNFSAIDVLVHTKAPFLVLKNPNTQSTYVQFLLQRPDDRALHLPLSYGSLVKVSYPGAAQLVDKVQYTVDTPSNWNAELRPLMEESKIVQGDYDLYRWTYARLSDWQTLPMSWSPLFTSDANQPVTAEKDPLFKAAQDDSDLNRTKSIIDSGRSVNERDPFGRPLICLVTDHRIFDFLISHHDFDRSVECAGGLGLLHLAAFNLDPEAIKKLIDLGMDVNKVDAEGDTPLHTLSDFYFNSLILNSSRYPHVKLENAKKISDYVSAIKLLVGASADLNKENNKQVKPLDRLREEREAVEKVAPELLQYIEKD